MIAIHADSAVLPGTGSRVCRPDHRAAPGSAAAGEGDGLGPWVGSVQGCEAVGAHRCVRMTNMGHLRNKKDQESVRDFYSPASEYKTLWLTGADMVRLYCRLCTPLHLQYMYYRRDLVAKLNVSVPATWEELIETARALNGASLCCMACLCTACLPAIAPPFVALHACASVSCAGFCHPRWAGAWAHGWGWYADGPRKPTSHCDWHLCCMTA